MLIDKEDKLINQQDRGKEMFLPLVEVENYSSSSSFSSSST